MTPTDASGEASVPPGRRICVVGTSGSGKTYVARALAALGGLHYISNDSIIWRAGWRQTPDAERLQQIDEASRAEAWTFDGNITPDRPDRPEDRLIFDRCDTLVWLDLPRRSVMWQVTLRSLRRLLTRERLWHGNVESLHTLLSRESIVWWAFKTYDGRRRYYERLFHQPEYSRAYIRMRSRREVNAWLRARAAGHAFPGSEVAGREE
jgi:adenylate kinase family enzyme